MKAIVMAGGEGTRLRPLTCGVPKPMVTLLDKPMLEYAVEHLLLHNIDDMAFTLMYKPSVITDYFSDYKKAKIDYFVEDTPLGTAGSVKNASLFVDGTFVIMSGDALTDVDITHAVSFHRQRGAKATIVLKKMGKPLEYGVVITDEQGRIERFVEKPGWEDVFSDTVNTGIYILEPDVLDLIPYGQKFDFAADLFPLMMKQGMPMYGYVTDKYWCDVGNIESYIKAHEDILRKNVAVQIEGNDNGSMYIGQDTYISNSAILQAPCYIGDGAIIGDGAVIGSYCSIGQGVRIGSRCNIKRSIVHKNASIAKNTKLSSCVVDSGSRIGERCNIYEGAVIGERCSLPGENNVYPHVKLWPSKWLAKGTSANENIVLGYGERADFINNTGFSADLGTDTTPLRLAKIFGAVAEFVSGKSVAVSSDDTQFANAALKQAVGMLQMSGCDVYIMYGIPSPVCANAAKIMNTKLAMYIGSTKHAKIYVRLFEPELFMLSKKTVKKLQAKYFSVGEQLADTSCGNTTYVGAANELYLNTLPDKIDSSVIRSYDTVIQIGGRRSIDELAAKIFNECGINVVRKQEAVPSADVSFEVVVSKNAEFCTIKLPSGRVLSKTEFETLVFYLIFSQTGKEKIILPSSTSSNVVSIAEIMDISFSYASKQEALLSLSHSSRRMLFDGIFAVCKLCEHLARTKTTIHDIAAMIEPEHKSVRHIGCSWQDMGRVIKSVYKMGDAIADEGLRLEVEDGYGYISPHHSLPKIVIRTEGYCQEFANELCDKYTDLVKKIIKDKK